jgi:hypothetical protein
MQRFGNKNASGKRSKKFSIACSERMKLKLQDMNYRIKIFETLEKAHIACRGKKRPQEVRDRIRKTILEQRGNPNRDYNLNFRSGIKEQVRMRDGYKCRICGCSQVENGVLLSVHHIDYDKKNTSLSNLIALCVNCHPQTNFNRHFWKMWFQENWHKEAVNLPYSYR